jgi:hypothetical protein
MTKGLVTSTEITPFPTLILFMLVVAGLSLKPAITGLNSIALHITEIGSSSFGVINIRSSAFALIRVINYMQFAFLLFAPHFHK